MKTAFVIQNAPPYSEAWMAGLVSAISPDLIITLEGAPYACARPSYTLHPARIRRGLARVSQVFQAPDISTRLLRLLERESVDVVVCNYLNIAILLSDVWEESSAKLFVHCHGWDVTFNMCHWNRVDSEVHGTAYVDAARKISERGTLVANSHFCASLLTDAGIDSARIKVCHLGVEVPELRRHHTLSDPQNVIAIGRLVDFKAPDRSVRAAHKALTSYPEGRFDLFGDGPLWPMVLMERSRLAHPTRIHLHGPTSHSVVQKALVASTVFTQHNVVGEVSKQAEAFGVSVLEAFAAGVPVVATRSGGVRETVIDDETGLLVEPFDELSQADALERLLGHPATRARLCENAYERVRFHFSISAWHERMQRMLHSRLP